MDLYTVMRTTFSAREFLDGPIPNDVLKRIFDNARFAPNGGNRQGWRVIVVQEQAHRNSLASLIEPTYRRYLAQVEAGENPWNTVIPTKLTNKQLDEQRMPKGLIERLVNAPTLLLVLVDLRVVASIDSELNRIGVISGASIYPFVWNILLAARNEGYGGTLTTFVVGEEPKVRKIFGIPDHYAVCAMLPMGKPKKQLTKLRRKPVEEFVTFDNFNGASL